MLLKRVALVLVLAGTIGMAGCGGDQPAEDGTAQRAPAGAAAGSGLQHIHGLGVSGATLYIAMHSGLWTAPEGQTKPRRFGSSQQDIMGFAILDDGRFIGSGHPDPRAANLPPNLGLIESRDDGRNWKSVSLLGKADFHVLESAGRQVYGVNSSEGSLMASEDAGRRWEQRSPPGSLLDLAIDPSASQRIVASSDRGLFVSADGGRGWRPLRADAAGLLAWPAAERLYLVGGDGSVQVSPDGGGEWQPAGDAGGQPAAFIAQDDELYVALADNNVKRSSDGGRSWTLRAAP